MLNKLRPYLTKVLNPFAKRITIHPNILTLISPFIALASALFFANGYLLEGGITILLSGLFDVLDGAVARYHNKTSEFGAFLDSTMDRFSDAIIIIGIIFGGYCSWFIGILAIHSAITVSYVRARAESKGIPCNVGIAERATRLILIVLGAIIGYYYNVSGNFLGTHYPNLYFGIIIIILIALSYFTVFQRVYHVYKHTKKEEERFKKRPITLSKEDNKTKETKKPSKKSKTKQEKLTDLNNQKTDLKYNEEDNDLEESDINILNIDEESNSIKLEDDWDIFDKVDYNKNPSDMDNSNGNPDFEEDSNIEEIPKKATKKIIRRKKKNTKTLKKE